MIRCSLHGAALKKNIPNLQRKVSTPAAAEEEGFNSARVAKSPVKPSRGGGHRRVFSEAVDIEQATLFVPPERANPCSATVTVVEKAQPTKHTLNEILVYYGASQFVCALIGSFGITPSVAASNTMYTVS